MKNRHNKVLVGLVASTSLVLAGCGQSSSTTGSASGKKQIKVALVLRTLSGVPVWASVRDGAQAEAKKLGVDLTVTAAANESDVTGQINKVQNALSANPDVLILTANGTTQLTPVLNQAIQKKIPVILVGQAVPTFKDYSSFIAGDDANGAKLVAQSMVKGLGDKAKGATVGVLGFPGNPTVKTRDDAAKKVFAANNMNIVQLPGNCDIATALNATQNMLTAHPKLAAVFGSCGTGDNGAVQAAKATGKKLIIGGIDGNTQEFQAIKSGDQYATALQDFKSWGSMAVKFAVDLKNGKQIPKNVLTKDDIITKANVDKFKPSA